MFKFNVPMKLGPVFKGQTAFTMHIDDESMKKWERQIYGMVESAAEGAEALVTEACQTILDNSREYVPTDTFTLLNSGYFRVDKRTARNDTGKRIFQFYSGVVGYGNDKAAGTVNPRTGMPASKYAWKVHEDLTMRHPNGGQAKFLERAYREYVQAEYGSELVRLEHNIYSGKKATPNFSYDAMHKVFNGWGVPKKSIRNNDSISNLDRLSSLPKGSNKGNSSWATRRKASDAPVRPNSGLHGYDPASANYKPIKGKKSGGDSW